MDRLSAIMQFLKSEYGITNESELDNAISKLKPVDIGLLSKGRAKSEEKFSETL